ncbi:hypothetical protein [Ekhidna sp.]|uniref:hypothetical protein n=1 Tax=Ekhidna sp. TaxID=2608089 RepID=UPI003BAD9011
MKKLGFISLIGILFLTAAFTIKSNIFQNPKDKIVGTWIPDEDGYDYRWVFKSDGVLEQYSDGNLDQKSKFFVTENPICEKPVTEESGLYYIVIEPIDFPLERTDGGKWIFCYELDGVTEDRLSLIYVGGASYSPTTFKRLKL